VYRNKPTGGGEEGASNSVQCPQSQGAAKKVGRRKVVASSRQNPDSAFLQEVRILQEGDREQGRGEGPAVKMRHGPPCQAKELTSTCP